MTRIAAMVSVAVLVLGCGPKPDDDGEYRPRPGRGKGGRGGTAMKPVKGDYKEGCVAMANAGPSTNGSQFFICTADDTRLPKQYNLFGSVKSGLDVAKRIQTTDHMVKVTIS